MNVYKIRLNDVVDVTLMARDAQHAMQKAAFVGCMRVGRGLSQATVLRCDYGVWTDVTAFVRGLS